MPPARSIMGSEQASISIKVPLSTDYIETVQKRNLKFKTPRLQRVLNRSDLRSKLGRIEYTKIHYGTGTRIFSGFGGFQYAVTSIKFYYYFII